MNEAGGKIYFLVLLNIFYMYILYIVLLNKYSEYCLYKVLQQLLSILAERHRSENAHSHIIWQIQVVNLKTVGRQVS